MASLNRLTAIGNLGRDPEVGYFPSGDMYANFSVACTEKWRDKTTGELREKTEWIPCVIHGKLAESFCRFAIKGTSVYVEGKFTTRSWDGADGKKNYKSEIRVETYEVLANGAKAEAAPGAAAPAPGRAPAAAPARPAAPAARPGAARPAPNFSDMDDDIPF